MITIDKILNTIKALYPDTINMVEKNKYFDYLNLFGVRVSSCDTSATDDIIGGFWLEDSFFKSFPNYNSIIVSASLDPSPYYIQNPIDPRGTAWIKEGQHIFSLGSYKGEAAFRPKGEVPVYRMPRGKNLDKTVATLSTSVDTLIHRSWSMKLYKDSAGCQVVPLSDLKKLVDRAKIHQKKYPQLKDKNGVTYFTYTLLTQEQVDKYGESSTTYSQSIFGLPPLPNLGDLFNTNK
jgi:hypothetical protein